MSSSCPTPDCSVFTANGGIPDLEPNPDVSGVGVLVGFLVTAFTALVLVIVHYIIGGDLDQASPNVVDRSILGFIWKLDPTSPDSKVLGFLWKRTSPPSSRWGSVLRKSIFQYSDAQLVTGIALLISGFVRLRCSISSYHWQIITYLAWFSSMTHLTTLTVLRNRFSSRIAIYCRVPFMFSMFILLIIALVPTGKDFWLNRAGLFFGGVPAKCYFNLHSKSHNGSLTYTMPISASILAISYLTRFLKLFGKAPVFAKRWGELDNHLMKVLRALKAITGSSGATPRRKLIVCVLKSVMFAILQATSDLYGSILLEITWLIFGLAWGTTRLILVRQLTTGISEENDWSFGQLLPVLLLVLPFFAVVETFIDEMPQRKAQSNHSKSPDESDVACQAKSPAHNYVIENIELPLPATPTRAMRQLEEGRDDNNHQQQRLSTDGQTLHSRDTHTNTSQVTPSINQQDPEDPVQELSDDHDFRKSGGFWGLIVLEYVFLVELGIAVLSSGDAPYQLGFDSVDILKLSHQPIIFWAWPVYSFFAILTYATFFVCWEGYKDRVTPSLGRRSRELIQKHFLFPLLFFIIFNTYFLGTYMNYFKVVGTALEKALEEAWLDALDSPS